MRKRGYLVYVAAAAVAIAIYYGTGHVSYLFNAIGLSSPIVILIAARMQKPEQRAPLYWLAAGLMLFIAGDIVAYNYPRVMNRPLPFPALNDVFYLLVYPCLVTGLVLLIRRRSPGRDWTSLIDALIIAMGVGMLSWIVLIAPYANDATLPLPQKLTSMAYPIADLILLATVARLTVGPGKRVPAILLMLAAVVVLFATDAINGWTLLTPNPYVGGTGLLDIGWASFYVLFGTAVLHPSMRRISDRAPEIENRSSWPRLALLGAASLLAPATQAVQYFRHEPSDLPVVLSATAILFTLVMFRLAGLVREQRLSATREKTLRRAGATLVTAIDTEGIHTAAIAAARAIAGEDAAIRLFERIGDTEDFVVVAADDPATCGRHLALASFYPNTRDRLIEGHAVIARAGNHALVDSLTLPAGLEAISIAPLRIHDALQGVLVATVPHRMPRDAVDALEALSSQVALALESAVLTKALVQRQSEERFASLVQNASDVVMVIDPDTTIRYASPSSSRVLGYDPKQLEGTRFADLVDAEDAASVLPFLTVLGVGLGHTGQIEFRMRRSDGTWVFAETVRTNLLDDPRVNGIVLNTRDISERKAFEDQLAHQAFHDDLTGLANRALFRDRVTHALERWQRDREPVAVLFLDLDDFKTINDSLGHAAGDQVLRQVGERLRQCLRPADTSARLGGDEFAILLEQRGDGVQAAEVADRIMQALEAPMDVDGTELFVRASLGIAIMDEDSPIAEEGAEAMLRNADVAMYMAKENSKGSYRVFEPRMHEAVLRRQELKADLQRAVENDEFILHYQPVIELSTGRIMGVEALIRWMHPVRGMIPPLDFIPLAEETGLIVPIGRWVLHEACAYAVTLQRGFASQEKFSMSVNLSARQLQRPEIVQEVAQIVQDTGIDPSTLVLEITESVMMQDMELSIERIAVLKELGVSFAIDDFGTGYSSLNYLARFPVDILKIDKSFVDGLSEGTESAALTSAVVALAKILNLETIAEGIEREDQLNQLIELGCEMGQGYFFARPLLPQDLGSMLAAREMALTPHAV